MALPYAAMQLFERCKQLKKIDGLVLKNCKLGSSSYELEACRWIASCEQHKGGSIQEKLTGRLEHDNGDGFEREKKDFELRNKSFIAASHPGRECCARFRFVSEEKENRHVSPREPFITIAQKPRAWAFLTEQHHHSIRVTVEYPESFPQTTKHKMSVAFLGSLHSDAFEFEWLHRKGSEAQWQAFDDSLQIENETEIRLPALRIASKRFSADALKCVTRFPQRIFVTF
jgi:hypothetical protein